MEKVPIIDMSPLLNGGDGSSVATELRRHHGAGVVGAMPNGGGDVSSVAAELRRDHGPGSAGAMPGGDVSFVAAELRQACEEVGFFYVTGHALEPSVCAELERAARQFFARPESEKRKIAMSRAGRAWRGWFPLGGELTSGAPDAKEGLYFGAEHSADHPRVQSGTPLFGQNQWPDEVPELRPAVQAALTAFERTAHALARGLSASLGLEPNWLSANYTQDPTLLFRIFHYPPGREGWGVGEHTDYGLLTLLLQDDRGGLEVKSKRGWISAPPIPGTLVCNLGDMLDRMTGGRYRSTPHRVRNLSGADRLSFPFFFDPAWDADLIPLPGYELRADDSEQRWDGEDVHAFQGTYGAYLLQKVARVFPDLAAEAKR